MEVEVKVQAKLSDEELVSRLIGAGFVKKCSERQLDIYLNHPCRDFKDTDEALRIRLTEGEVSLCYKGPRMPGKAKMRVEIEVKIGDLEKMYRILRALGFYEVARVEKQREVYERGGVSIALDEVKGLGRFIEIEGGSEEAVLRVAEELGLRREDFVDATYLEMVLSKLEKTK